MKPEVLASPDALYVRIEEALARSTPVLLAIDGPCASGKTTLARLLAKRYQAPIVAMDDFFLPMYRKTEARLAEPGGNLDYERFRDEVVPFLRDGLPFSYRRFDCHRQDFAGRCDVPVSPLRLIEGAYSLHPLWRDLYTLRCFLTIDPEEQARRLLLRNGPDGAARFRQQWIPLENHYFNEYRIAESADYLLTFEPTPT